MEQKIPKKSSEKPFITVDELAESLMSISVVAKSLAKKVLLLSAVEPKGGKQNVSRKAQ